MGRPVSSDRLPLRKSRWFARRSRLARDIAVILAVKVVVLWLIWATWFSPAHRERVQAHDVDRTIYSGPKAHP